MATPNLAIGHVQEGQDNPEVELNAGLDAFDLAMTGTIPVDLTSGAAGPTDEQFRRNIEFVAQGHSLDTALNVPAIRRPFIIRNTGTANAVVTRGAATCPVPPGKAAIFYTDGSADGLHPLGSAGGSVVVDWKDSVRVASTADITLSGMQTIDGVALAVDDSVLVKDQSTASENGIYLVAAGAWTRRTDFDESVEVTAGAAVVVAEGTANADTVYLLTTDDPISVGVSALSFSQLTGGSFVVEKDDMVVVAVATTLSFTGGVVVTDAGGGQATVDVPSPYDIGNFFGGTPDPSVSILTFLFTRPVTFAAGLTESRALAGTAPNAQTDFDLRKGEGGPSFGTMRFANASQVATFIAASETSFTPGETLEIVAPAALNGIADLLITIAGTRG